MPAAFAMLPVARFALGQPQIVKTAPTQGSFSLANAGVAAKIYVDPNDWPGVIRAAHDLQADMLTGYLPLHRRTNSCTSRRGRF